MKQSLEGEAAFQAIRELLNGGNPGIDFCCPSNPPLERLRTALTDILYPGSRLDVAVLIRQALNYQTAKRGNTFPAQLLVQDRPQRPGEEEWRKVSIRARRSGNFWELLSEEWKPAWLPDSRFEAVDLMASSEPIRRDFEAEKVPGDPFLKSVQCEHYRSIGQRSAVRSALCMPQGATLIVSLPTGEGKSLIFRLIDAIGFGDTHEKGVTLVIVPTITLALDHEKSTIDPAGQFTPRAYIGGTENAERNKAILTGIESGQQGLCFASPEAVVRPMRSSLRKAAEMGLLKAVVIDEAHLVESWGTGFRSEFQMLSGIRRELLSVCPEEKRFRTVLLSATMTQPTLNTLETLFQDTGPLGFISHLSLRPEIEFWIGNFTTEGQRHSRVLEALAHVPRPAILYVTKVADAKDWFTRLTNDGFSRIGLVHGETASFRRQEVLRDLHSGLTDIVVATSAFGLGIDYPHIRTIIHACIPETLDRFYQEVGRGGRDGRACLSLILPAYEDIRTAEFLNNELVISVDRGLQRWKSMFNHQDRIVLGNGVFVVRLDIPPSALDKDIDMHGQLSTEWNARTLTLMARSGLIRLLGLPTDLDRDRMDPEGTFQALEIVDTEHLTLDCWNRRVKPFRDDFWKANLANLGHMHEFLQKQTCPADLVASLYRVKTDQKEWTVARNCGGCSIGRTPPGCCREVETPIPPNWPWPASSGLTEFLQGLLDEGNRLVIRYDPKRIDRAWRRRFKETFNELYRGGVRNFFLMGGLSSEFHPLLFSFAEDKPVFVGVDTVPAVGHLPPGPAAIILSPGVPLNPSPFNHRVAGSERFFFISEETEDPTRPGIRFFETYPGRRFSFDDFHRRITQ